MLIKDNCSKPKANIILIKVKGKTMILNVNSIVNTVLEILTNTRHEKNRSLIIEIKDTSLTLFLENIIFYTEYLIYRRIRIQQEC